jgi:hypothetical protein
MKLNNAYTKVIYKRYQTSMNYSADKLTAIFGCTVSDIVDINKEILFEQIRSQCLFNVYDIAENYIKLLPTGDFGYWIMFNRNIWVLANKKLWKRHKKAEEIYYDALEECKKARDEFYELADAENPFYLSKYEDAYDAAYKKDYTTFRELVEIEKTILQCRIVTQKTDWKNWTQMDYNIKLFYRGLTPFDVKT